MKNDSDPLRVLGLFFVEAYTISSLEIESCVAMRACGKRAV